MIPTLEEVTGTQVRRGPPARAPRAARRRPRTTSCGCCSRRSTCPSPIDAYFGARLLHRAHLQRVPRHGRTRSSTTASCARRSRSACAQGKGPVTPDGEMERERYRVVVEGPPNWTSFRAVLEDVRRRGRGGRRLHLHEGGRRLRPRLPPRPRSRPLETLADYCLGCYTNLNLPDARSTCSTRYVERVRGRRLPHQLGQELQLVQRRPAAHPARGREARSGRPGRLHRERPRRSALLLGGQHQEPARVVLPDDRAEARGGGGRHEATPSASTSARPRPRPSCSTRTARCSAAASRTAAATTTWPARSRSARR